MLAVPSGSSNLYHVLWVEQVDWHGQPTYYRAIVRENDPPEIVFDVAGEYEWVCPDGVSEVSVELWGGGSNGSPGLDSLGGGGAAYAAGSMAVTSGSTYTVVGRVLFALNAWEAEPLGQGPGMIG